MRPVVTPPRRGHHVSRAFHRRGPEPGTPAPAAGLSFPVATGAGPPSGGLVGICREPSTGAGPRRPSGGGLPPVESAHPSPVSAGPDFSGSLPSGRVDGRPARQGGRPVGRSLP